ncbi:membrane protein [Kineosporia sp. NBRC 101677]|nr:membrane protein [Kineosporia sp. NBRC 101677]
MVFVLKGFLAVLFGVLVMLQTFSFPGQFAYMAEQNPDDAHLRWPLTVLTGFWLLCAEAVVVSTWKLLGLIRRDRIFSEDAFTWVNVILAAIAAAWLVLTGFFLWVGFNADDPGVPLLLFLLVVGLAVAGLLMLVMRALLRQATTLRSDLEGVI